MCIVQPMSHVDCVHVCCSPFSFKLFFQVKFALCVREKFPLQEGSFSPRDRDVLGKLAMEAVEGGQGQS